MPQVRALLTVAAPALCLLLVACERSESRADDELAPSDSSGSVRTPDSECTGYRACLAAAEPSALAKRTDVRRDSLQLVFTVIGGPPVTLTNGNPAYEDSHYYLYSGWDETLRAHRVHILEYESDALAYVYPSSGAVVVLDDLPLVSPSARYLATTNWDTEAQMEWNRARVYRILPDSLALEWEIAPELWGPDSPRWRDDSTLVIRRAPALGHPDSTSLALPLIVRRVQNAWHADSGARAP